MLRGPMEIDVREVSPADPSVLEGIGRLRVAVWKSEGALSASLAARGVWLDAFDPVARHWIATDAAGALVAAGRLTMHAGLEESPDGYVWLEAGRRLEGPIGNVAKLVVSPEARGRGLASALNRIRVDAARRAGARTLTVTASAANARLLERIGFVDSGLRATFEDRPGFPFRALELALPVR